LATFATRLGLQGFSDGRILLQALTHKSFDHARIPTNERLEYLGKQVVNLYVGQYLHAKYPTLPVNTIRDAQEAYCGFGALGRLGTELGVNKVMRWKPALPSAAGGEERAPGNKRGDKWARGETKVAGRAVASIIGALYHDQGPAKAMEFVKAHVLSREVDVTGLLVLSEPKRLLTALMQRKKMDRPISRLLSETGRLSNNAVYLVGVYSGERLLGTGYGSSKAMAEHRAAKEVISKYYLTEAQDFEIGDDVPSEKD
ncbi:ribonuclease III domain-containing protein, partial [Piptocephalis cylindrospora]